jgi:hypothetical protein
MIDTMNIKIGKEKYKNIAIETVASLGDIAYIDRPILLTGDLVVDRKITNISTLYVLGSLVINGGEFNNLGELIFLEGEFRKYTIDRAISGESCFTGVIIEDDVVCGDMFINVLGPGGNSIEWVNSFKYKSDSINSPFFFMDSSGDIVRKDFLQKGDRLYWNESVSGIKLYPTWDIVIYFS